MFIFEFFLTICLTLMPVVMNEETTQGPPPAPTTEPAHNEDTSLFDALFSPDPLSTSPAPTTGQQEGDTVALYEKLSGLVEPSPDGGYTLKVSFVETLEQLKPMTDAYVDTTPLINVLKGFEEFQKTTDAAGNATDKIQETVTDSKDGTTQQSPAIQNTTNQP